MPIHFRKSPCRHRAMDARAEIVGGARQRLKIDMGGDVGLTGIFQRVGEAVTAIA